MSRKKRDSPTGETFRPPEDGAKERRKLGGHHTPMDLAEQVVRKALEPHLMWMSQDPEGWDRAHAARDAPVHGPIRAPRSGADRRHEERLARERAAFRLDKIAAPLLIALEAAVPLAILEMRRLSPEMRIEIAHGLAETVASKSDILMFGSKKKGEVAEIFNAVARGLAACAYQPGGVTWCGIHWEATA